MKKMKKHKIFDLSVLSCTNSRHESQIHWHWFAVCSQSAEQPNCLHERVTRATAGQSLSTLKELHTGCYSNSFVLLGNSSVCLWPAAAAWLRVSHMSSNSIVFSSPNLHTPGTQTNCGPSGVCDPSFFLQVCLLKLYLKNQYEKKINKSTQQYN